MITTRRVAAAGLALATAAVLAAGASGTASATPAPAQVPTGDVTVVAAADISCPAGRARTSTACGDDKTARTVTTINPLAIIAPGDLQYESGTATEFANSYAKTWGPFKSKTYPVPGNHEWNTSGASGYKSFFATGVPAGVRMNPTWYSADIGAWHMIGLDSNCAKVGGCGAGSAQYTWLQNDLAANNGKPTIVQWHHPRWSSGSEHGSSTVVDPLYRLLVADTDVQLGITGHDHDYERFAPMGVSGPDAKGFPQFVVGAAGVNLRGKGTNVAGSQSFNGTSFGVLKLTLKGDGSYGWAFVASSGTFTDSGTQPRRGGPVTPPPTTTTPVPTTTPAPTTTPVPTTTTPPPTTTPVPTTTTPPPTTTTPPPVTTTPPPTTTTPPPTTTTPTPVPTAQCVTYGVRSHIVKAGETLYGISRLCGTTVAQIKSWNWLWSDTIRVGQILRVKP